VEEEAQKFSIKLSDGVFIDPSIHCDHFVETKDIGNESDSITESYSDVERTRKGGSTMMEYGLNFSHG
jgi:hypothetical protein